MTIDSKSISVVIPAYNAEKSIATAIESVLAQDLKPAEIVVVDDGSQDATAEIVQGYDDVTYIRQQNAGSSAARNHGIQACQGQWIAFLDSDDRWKPEKLSKQFAILDSNPHLRWSAGAYDQVREGKLLPPTTFPDSARYVKDGVASDALEIMARGWPIWTGTVVMHRELLQESKPFDERQRTSHDLDLWIRTAARHPQIAYELTPIADYVMENEGSLTATAISNHDKTQLLFFSRALETASSLNAMRQQHVVAYVRDMAVSTVKTSLWRGFRPRAKWLVENFTELGIELPKWMRIAVSLPSFLVIPTHRALQRLK